MDEQNLNQGEKPEKDGIFVMGVGDDFLPPYPAWRYHEVFEPMMVHDTEEDKLAELQGWIEMDVSVTGIQHFSNWRHDFEDMTSRQLVLFAMEEFGVDLPIEATEEQLVKAMWQLTHLAPQHSGRITLLAQSVTMDYDKTCSDIYKMAESLVIDEKKEIVI